jgi:hypothetical protein
MHMQHTGQAGMPHLEQQHHLMVQIKPLMTLLLLLLCAHAFTLTPIANPSGFKVGSRWRCMSRTILVLLLSLP